MTPDEHAVYLTFDDGPHPVITPWVLDQLKQFDAMASFFCIGRNVQAYPEIYRRILNENHSVGNHTYDHLNGWKTNDATYLSNVAAAAKIISSNLFRPPYGRLRKSQAKRISSAMENQDAKIIMWDVLSADFDQEFSEEQCLSHVIENISAGSIVVFHDSEKAFRNLKFILPEVLQYVKAEGFAMKKIEFRQREGL
jgi:peptidoglycan/xylan/chitin deacetylase (PgdA/CDA1 family)